MKLDEVKEVFEHSPWVAERAWKRGPFASADALHAAMMAVVREATPEEQLALIRAHPELAGAEAKEGTLTRASSSEQGRLGFDAVTRKDLYRMTDLNRRYREKFGFPCIVALSLHQNRDSVMDEMQRRLDSSPESELKAALKQIGHIARGRLDKLAGKGRKTS